MSARVRRRSASRSKPTLIAWGVYALIAVAGWVLLPAGGFRISR